MNWTAIIAIINFGVVIFGAIGGILGIRRSMAKATSDIQERVMHALETENKVLQDRFTRLEEDNRQLQRRMKLVIAMLKRTYNIDLDIDDDIITLRNASGKSSSQSAESETA